jgi:hypothetical protein
MIRLSRLHQVLLLLSLCVSVTALAKAAEPQRKPGGDEGPIFHEYRGVKIGSPAEEVRKKLGNPTDKSAEQDFFVFGDKESAQILYDKSGKVVTISVDFLNGASGVLTPKDLFGGEIEAKSDGSAYRMVRYPKAGCWLSYNKTAGAQPLVTVTLQKIDE